MSEKNLALTLKAPAKVNLYLRVLGRRADGYHELDSVFHAVGLYDRITLARIPEGITFTCTDPDLETDDNLCVRAARLLMTESAEAQAGGVKIHLEKTIPAGGGLGGGSSDAAAVLTGLNRLWGLGLDRERLMELAAVLGSDVPFFIHGGAARISGRGERMTPVPPLAGQWCVLVNPGVHVDTGAVFAAFSANSNGLELTEGADPSIITDARVAAREAAVQVNDLERAACCIAPDIGEALAALKQAGGDIPRMSGSGGTVFCLAPSERAAGEIRDRLERAPRWKVWVVPMAATGADDGSG